MSVIFQMSKCFVTSNRIEGSYWNLEIQFGEMLINMSAHNSTLWVVCQNWNKLKTALQSLWLTQGEATALQRPVAPLAVGTVGQHRAVKALKCSPYTCCVWTAKCLWYPAAVSFLKESCSLGLCTLGSAFMYFAEARPGEKEAITQFFGLNRGVKGLKSM